VEPRRLLALSALLANTVKCLLLTELSSVLLALLDSTARLELVSTPRLLAM